MAILYIAAEAAELQPFADLLGNVNKLNWPLDYACESALHGRRVILAANGAGRKLAAHAVEIALRAVPYLKAVVSTGYCGALAAHLRENDIIVGDGARVPQSEGKSVSGQILCSDTVVCNAVDKQRMGETGAIAVDMESAGVEERTKRADLPFYCIKVVTDRSEETFSFDLNRMRTPQGRISRGKIVLFAATHWTALPELFRLKRRSEAAAEALGEFLVSCRIDPQ